MAVAEQTADVRDPEDECRRRLVRAWCALKDDNLSPARKSARALREVEAAMEAMDVPLKGPGR